MDALGAEKTKLESLLAALGSFSRQLSPKKASNMGPQNISCNLLFTVPSRGPNLDPHFMGFQEDFRGFQMHFQGCRTHFWRYRWQANKSFILQLRLWNALPPSKPRPERGGTAVSGRITFRIRRPTLIACRWWPDGVLNLERSGS